MPFCLIVCLTATPELFIYVRGNNKHTFCPCILPSAVKPFVKELNLNFNLKLSAKYWATKYPRLCLVNSYSLPGFPNPTIIFISDKMLTLPFLKNQKPCLPDYSSLALGSSFFSLVISGSVIPSSAAIASSSFIGGTTEATIDSGSCFVLTFAGKTKSAT